MSKSSLIRESGQLWKLRVFYIGVFGGAGAILFGNSHIGGPHSLALPLGGALVALLALVLVSVSIRCPSCGMRWFWHAVTTLDRKQVWPWLQNETVCPRCGKSGNGAA